MMIWQKTPAQSPNKDHDQMRIMIKFSQYDQKVIIFVIRCLGVAKGGTEREVMDDDTEKNKKRR